MISGTPTSLYAAVAPSICGQLCVTCSLPYSVCHAFQPLHCDYDTVINSHFDASHFSVFPVALGEPLRVPDCVISSAAASIGAPEEIDSGAGLKSCRSMNPYGRCIVFIISHVRGSGAYFNTLFYVRWQLDALTLAVAGARVLSRGGVPVHINCIMLT